MADIHVHNGAYNKDTDSIELTRTDGAPSI